MRDSLLDRLRLTEGRIHGMAQALREVAEAPDPVGRVLSGEVRPNGLQIQKVTVPLGVIGIIYEARPNVTSDAAGLCLKAGNAVILRGGKEAFRSNLAVTPGAAGRPGGERPARRLRAAGGGHQPPVGPGADGAHRVSGRAHPPGRGGAHPGGEGELPGAGD